MDFEEDGPENYWISLPENYLAADLCGKRVAVRPNGMLVPFAPCLVVGINGRVNFAVFLGYFFDYSECLFATGNPNGLAPLISSDIAACHPITLSQPCREVDEIRRRYECFDGIQTPSVPVNPNWRPWHERAN